MDTNKSTDCGMREALMAYLYNEATSEERHAVERHLAGCAHCKQELSAFERVRSTLQQWQVDDLPVVRVLTTGETQRRSALGLLKELFGIAPLWAKGFAGLAAALLLFAVLGTEVSVGRDGFSMRADLLRKSRAVATVVPDAPPSVSEPGLEPVRAEIRAIVDEMISESERERREDLRAQMVRLEAELQTLHAAELAKISARIQEQRSRLKTIERDLDRRDQMDLTDILFGEVRSNLDRRGSD